MAIVWADGFDHYGTTPSGGRTAMLQGAWAQFNAGNGNLPYITSDQKRTGENSLRFEIAAGANGACFARRVMGATEIVVGCGFGVFFSSLPNVNNEYGMAFLNNANENIVRIAVESDGSISVYRGTAGTTLVGSSDPVIGASSWNHIESRVVIDNVVGEVEVRVNGLTVLHFTDLDLKTVGSTQLRFGSFAAFQAGRSMYVDDIVVWNDDGDANNDFIGPASVETIFPVADTAVADFTPVGDSDGFDCIDNVPPDGDTTYIAGANEGDVSEFELGTLPPETEIIKAVYIPFLGKLEDAGIGNAQVSLVSGADVSLGPDTVLTTAYTYWGGIHDVDPATGLEWTKAGLEAALVRVEKTL